MNILITDPDNINTPGTHAYNVRAAFLLGYESAGLEWQGEILHHTMTWDFSYVQNAGPDMWIQSYTGLSAHLGGCNALYPILPVMVAGGNSVDELISATIPQQTLITGAGDVSNETADNVEFIAPDPIGTDVQDYSSFANPYIAGQIAAIMDICNCNHWEARYRARMTGSKNGVWHETDGFGFINILKAVTYKGEIPADPWYTWPVPVQPKHIAIQNLQLDNIYAPISYVKLLSAVVESDKATFIINRHYSKDKAKLDQHIIKIDSTIAINNALYELLKESISPSIGEFENE